MPTSSASASVEDLGQSKSKKKIVIRAFKQEWKVGRPWLVYEKGLMFCSICREGKLITAKGSEKTNALIAGTDNIKLETIKLHEGTRQNRDMPVLKSPAGTRCGFSPNKLLFFLLYFFLACNFFIWLVNKKSY